MSKSKKIDRNLLEITSKHPKWLQESTSISYRDETMQKIMMFYIINTPCKNNLSEKHIPLTKYGWIERPWNKESYLKTKLKEVANLDEKTCCTAEKRTEMKLKLRKADLCDGFEKNIVRERIAVLITDSNLFDSIFHHIRNSLAHGRFAIMGQKEEYLIMEDGSNLGADFEVKARMILKKSTLLQWIDILEAGPEPPSSSASL